MTYDKRLLNPLINNPTSDLHIKRALEYGVPLETVFNSLKKGIKKNKKIYGERIKKAEKANPEFIEIFEKFSTNPPHSLAIQRYCSDRCSMHDLEKFENILGNSADNILNYKSSVLRY
jgi:hypothetical protein